MLIYELRCAGQCRRLILLTQVIFSHSHRNIVAQL